ncbi:MAG: hypothetical protein CK427_16930 [Leptospira sp.]|nr:MAG: hypothetical protein CK427_16930 [Leptospira sp.]
MKIKRIKYADKGINWELNEINFFDLTLLVGQSGAGKSQIIHAIKNIRDIATGSPINGVEWEIEFIGNDSKTYRWLGEYQNKGEIFSLRRAFSLDYDEYSTRPSPPLVMHESLFKEGQIIISRDQEAITFQTEKTPKLNPYVSAINLLQEEEIIRPASDSFKSIIFKDFSSKYRDDEYYMDDIEVFGKKIKNLDHLKNLGTSISIKLAICYIYFKDYFEKIKNAYVSIFPQVEDIKYEKLTNEDLPFYYKRNPILQIKESGVEN